MSLLPTRLSCFAAPAEMAGPAPRGSIGQSHYDRATLEKTGAGAVFISLCPARGVSGQWTTACIVVRVDVRLDLRLSCLVTRVP
jgi:hypothetical protein